ncbi:hypothetical protein H5V45_04505 [Nocardioides sp. KIGAM211]|uniref:Uncharacterized protein n=1 Tax=Nocardioides luti TaxID=2761101 RepID=A0A7X0V9S0_9ACTN|nr:hypothetical protein [Nocardioides luti]MBB6626580.1 hypothetical protein [Nocardioides luti]
MLTIALVMLVIVVLAVLVVTYVAFPHRGEEVPAAPWLGDAMAKAAEAAPTLPTEGDEVHGREVAERQEAQHRA